MNEVITIDGPAGSGKSTVGKILAKKIGYKFIDSGLFYRAGSAYIFVHKILINDLKSLVKVFSSIDLEYIDDLKIKVTVLGEDVTDLLHTDNVSKLVPDLAAIKEVRESVRLIQRKLCSDSKVVMAGRDIGTEIFPDAKLKFYLTASPEVRAQRRLYQMKLTHPNMTYEEVLESTKLRDIKDTTRVISPLKIPEGAVVIDSSDQNINQVVSEMAAHIS